MLFRDTADLSVTCNWCLVSFRGFVMSLTAVKKREPKDDDPEPCDVIDICPLCMGKMEAVYSRSHQKVCVCRDCHVTITIPSSSWEIARVKREALGLGSRKK